TTGLTNLYRDVRSHFDRLAIACNCEQVKIESSMEQCDERMRFAGKQMDQYCQSLRDLSQAAASLSTISHEIRQLTFSLATAVDHCNQLQLLLPGNQKKRIPLFTHCEKASRIVFQGNLLRKETMFGSVRSRTYVLTRDGLLTHFSLQGDDIRHVIDLKCASEVVANGMTGLCITTRNKHTNISETWNFLCVSENEVVDWLTHIHSLDFNKDRSKQLTYLSAPTNCKLYLFYLFLNTHYQLICVCSAPFFFLKKKDLSDNLRVICENVPSTRAILPIEEKWSWDEKSENGGLVEGDLLLYSNGNDLYCMGFKLENGGPACMDRPPSNTRQLYLCSCKD
ncbi:hypothetical protein RFI_13868, partial [Reticulomyxa filosa]